MESDVEGLTEGAEEMRDELRTSVRGNVGGNSVLREYMEEEKLCELRGCNCVVSRNEDALFGQTINDNKYGSETGGRRKLFNKIHRYGVPWFLGDRELF